MKYRTSELGGHIAAYGKVVAGNIEILPFLPARQEVIDRKQMVVNAKSEGIERAKRLLSPEQLSKHLYYLGLNKKRLALLKAGKPVPCRQMLL